VINYLRHNSRSYIFSASNTPAATAAARAALHIMKTEPERIQHLWDMTNYALDCFRTMGFEIGNTSTPIIPLYVRDMEKTFLVTKMLFDEGVFVNPVIPPACSPEDTLIRFSLMATHTKEQIDIAVDKLVKCFKQLGIIK
ncbi:MAG TPA: aminotransferase class I/II-fold pyridoxal phosphate-dependent enzyme, partial [Candidatus Avibacteroides faecavium]|nr:aminotransferase class I/II-fold pyridoxal phosphate-dependent enzyme [Candidatus Avibacteroides faecavium]